MSKSSKYEDNIHRISNLFQGLYDFWRHSGGWARTESYEILKDSRLDRLSSQALTLLKYKNATLLKSDGELISAWTTLGSLLEGALILFLSIWIDEYGDEISQKKLKFLKASKGNLKQPHKLTLDGLKQFFAKRIFTKKIRKIWQETGEVDWIDWIGEVQKSRNSIHSFPDRQILRKEVFYIYIEEFLNLLRNLISEFPYPDESYRPKET